MEVGIRDKETSAKMIDYISFKSKVQSLIKEYLTNCSGTEIPNVKKLTIDDGKVSFAYTVRLNESCDYYNGVYTSARFSIGKNNEFDIKSLKNFCLHCLSPAIEAEILDNPFEAALLCKLLYEYAHII